MGTVQETETKRALRTGFHQGARVHPGQTFVAPVSFKAKWFKPASEADDVVEDGGNALAAELDNPIRSIVDKLQSYSDADLPKLLSAEQSGAARKGLMAAIGDEIANRISDPKTGAIDPLS